MRWQAPFQFADAKVGIIFELTKYFRYFFDLHPAFLSLMASFCAFSWHPLHPRQGSLASLNALYTLQAA
jgi:hypothetical protein